MHPHTHILCTTYRLDNTNLKQTMGGWESEHQLFVFEFLLEKLNNIITNASHLPEKSLSLFATDTSLLALLYCEDSGRNTTHVKLGWNFHLPICKKVKNLFFCNSWLT